MQKGVVVELVYTSEDKPIRTARAGELRGPHRSRKMEQNSPAVGAPVEPSVRPRAWADAEVMAGQVGNCASDAAKTYWQRSNQFDRMMAERLTHPLYDQAAVDAARMAGVRSVQEQTAVIVRAALELLESIEGETPFTAEALRAFKRVFGA